MDRVKINNRAKAPFFQQFNEKVDRSLTVMSVLIKFYDKTINKFGLLFSKFIFSKKATRIDKIFTIDLTFTT